MQPVCSAGVKSHKIDQDNSDDWDDDEDNDDGFTSNLLGLGTHLTLVFCLAHNTVERCMICPLVHCINLGAACFR